jgi:hypothetical protein
LRTAGESRGPRSGATVRHRPAGFLSPHRRIPGSASDPRSNPWERE